MHRHPDIVRMLLLHKANVDARDHIAGLTYVVAAVQNQHRDVIQVLLSAKADVHGIPGPCAGFIRRVAETNRIIL